MSEKEPLTFRLSEEVEAVAWPLIRNFHKHLANERIVYLFRSEPEKIGGKTALGTARKISGLNAFLAGQFGEAFQSDLLAGGDSQEPEAFFVMQIWEFGWARMGDAARIALVDHELCHFFAEDDKLTIQPHDLEEFVAVVHRHGLWRPDVEEFVRVANRKAREDQDALFEGAMGAGVA